MAQPSVKVVLLGDSGVGKTCLRSQFVHHVFTSAYKATIGGDYLTTTVEIPDANPTVSSTGADLDPDENTAILARRSAQKKSVGLQIWDTAGQERFNSISQAFYRGTDVVVLVYDVTNYESVLSIRDWFVRFIDHCQVRRPGVVIVGNKIDKTAERCVDLEEIREIVTNTTGVSLDVYVDDWQKDLMEVTAKQLDSVTKVFNRVAQLGLELSNDDENTYRHRIVGFDSIDLEGVKKQSKCC